MFYVLRMFAGVPASLSAFAVAFAGVPQVSRHLPWRLRDSRKSLGVCRGVCGSPASLAAFAAGCLRTPANLAGGVCGRRRSLPGTRRPSCRQGRGVLHTPHRAPRHGANDHIRRPSIRAHGPVWCWFVGGCAPLVCWCGYPCRRRNSIRPTGRHHRWRIHVPGVWSFGPFRVRLEGVCNTPLPGYVHRYVRRYGHSGLWARLGGRIRYAPTPVRAFAPSGRVPGQLRRRPQTPRPASLPRQRPF